MKTIEKYPVIMLVIGILGISLSAIFVRFSTAPSVVTAAYRLLWTVLLMTPYALGSPSIRGELKSLSKQTVLLCIISGVFLAFHFYWWVESLRHTSVASSTVIVCTEVIWVAIGFCIFLKGHLSKRALLAIGITLFGSILVACSDSSGGGGHLYGDFLSLIAAIAVAAYTLIGRIARKHMTTTSYTYIVYGSCAAVLCMLTYLQGYALFPLKKDAATVGFLLAVCSTLLGHSIFSWCLKYMSPAFISASKLCEPVVASLFALFLFMEIPGWLQIMGGVIILAGVIYYSKLPDADL